MGGSPSVSLRDSAPSSSRSKLPRGQCLIGPTVFKSCPDPQRLRFASFALHWDALCVRSFPRVAASGDRRLPRPGDAFCTERLPLPPEDLFFVMRNLAGAGARKQRRQKSQEISELDQILRRSSAAAASCDDLQRAGDSMSSGARRAGRLPSSMRLSEGPPSMLCHCCVGQRGPALCNARFATSRRKKAARPEEPRDCSVR